MNARSRMIATGIIVPLCTIALFSFLGSDPGGTRSPRVFFTSNEEFTGGLYTNLDLGDVKKVFGYIFSRLNDEVKVYPTEGYYYFRFTAKGNLLVGSIALYSNQRDSGVLGFGFNQIAEDKITQQSVGRIGAAHDFTRKDGLEMEKVDDFNYRVTYQGKTVTFNLHTEKFLPLKKARIMEDEVLVGPGFDESGLRFFLIFNTTARRLYWILNEEGYVPESFSPFTPHLVTGDRTAFAFYLDSLNNRKILVGADVYNVLQNNWYDGPFDQMPDTYVQAGLVEVKKYLTAHYELDSARIDRYGYFTDNPGVRIPVAPYVDYLKKEDLLFVEEYRKQNLPPSQFYAKITRQFSNMPEGYHY